MTEMDKEIQELRQKVDALEQENTQMRQRIGAYVCEFRVCRFCSNLHADCSPTDGSCVPMWRGL